MEIFKNDQFELDHIGIAVSSLLEGKKFYEALGFREIYCEDVVTEQVRVGMYGLGNQVSIELLEPLSEESPIQKFLDKRGGGIHHYCMRVKNIEKVAENLVKQGVRLINSEPRPGAHGTKVVFVHPKSSGGVLVELSEVVNP